jgi:hypothetical protein
VSAFNNNLPSSAELMLYAMTLCCPRSPSLMR